MTTSRLIEAAIVSSLFLAYLALWRIKRARDIRRNAIDPDVLGHASTPLQAYFATLVRLMTAIVAAIIVLHAVAPSHWPPLVRLTGLDSRLFDLLGGALGAAGLMVCALAQNTMGTSCRVGIDTENSTALVICGIYRWVRNPTYLGLHVVNLGLWLVWPTTLVAAFLALFFVIMDIQVRCEDEHLSAVHGERYQAYVARTWRYVPWIY